MSNRSVSTYCFSSFWFLLAEQNPDAIGNKMKLMQPDVAEEGTEKTIKAVGRRCQDGWRENSNQMAAPPEAMEVKPV